MRPSEEDDGRSHDALTVTVDDHHPRPKLVQVADTTTSIGAGADFDLDVSLGSSAFQVAWGQLMGPNNTGGATLWREGCSVHASRDSSEAMAHSQRDSGSAYKSYSATYSKGAGDSYLSHKVFNNSPTQDYIALKDAVLTGSVLRLTFHNYAGSSQTLWVKGSMVVA